MVRITIDKATQEKLLSSGEVVELVDENGKLLGRVLPEIDDFPNGWTPLTPELSEEELDRRSQKAASSDLEGCITTEELLARLRAKK